jgi:GT2 family glycosyltransferase/SAM-dependent methyltransferase
MSARRRSGAARLIEWTGERCVPWSPDIQVVYEHFHRYLWAAQLTAGKRVLDLASGEGFGAALLSEGAATVVGVDIDPTAVEHAQLNYIGSNLEYRTADARDLSQFEDASFHVVVAFELIEHIAEHDVVLGEITRVLTPGGLAIVSTPERSAYDNGPGTENPFHVRELGHDEFDALLGSRFAHHRMWAQHVMSGSAMKAIDDGPSPDGRGLWGVDGASFMIEPEADEWRSTDVLPLLYMVALASDAELPEVPAGSTLIDAQMAMLRSRSQELADRLNPIITARGEEITARGEAIRELERHVGELERQASRIGSQLSDWKERYERLASNGFAFRKTAELRLAHQEAAHARAAQEQARVEGEVRNELRSVLNVLGWRQRQLNQMEASIIWRATMRFRGKLISVLGGEGGMPVRAVQAGLRLSWRLMGNAPAGEGVDGPAEVVEEPGTPALIEPLARFEPVNLELSEDPVISIVIPLYAGAELTHRALQTIRDNTSYTRYEVIIVDDGDDPDTKALLETVTGARILTNEENLGYLRSANKGAQVAQGRWLVLANNDIEVLPNWAAELLDCGESADDIAIVTPLYLQPDGLVSEAGGIIWDDASGHNYGRGDHSHNWRYGFRREVDYGSAAALLVRTDVWRDIGGFDERFLPMYYEDVDLCFAARDLGYRVMYEPAARVVHKEGSTAGSDENEGHKRHQAANRPRFGEKWEAALSQHHLSPPDNVLESWAGATARRGSRVIFIDHRVPFWDREAGALRTLEVLKSLMDRGHHVTFLPDNGAGLEPYTTELQRRGIEVMHGPDLLTQLSILIAPHIQAAIVSRPSVAARYMSLLRRHAPQAELIYDCV